MIYTVIGVWLDDKPTVVGVIAGKHEVYGGEEETFPDGLWSTDVTATGVEDAEQLARTDMIENKL